MNHSLLRCLAAMLTIGSLSADVVISEIMFHPSSEKTSEEYIELLNTGSTEVDLSAWTLTNGISFTFPAATHIPASGRLVIAADATAFTTKYPNISNFVAGWTGRLSNSSNKITLVNALGTHIDEVNYSDDGDWSVRAKDTVADYGHYGLGWKSTADGGGSSLELIQPAFDNATGQNWAASLTTQGTPGSANSVAATDIAPVIGEVAHFPLIPSSSDPVVITARVTDDHGLPTTVEVRWRVDGTSSFSMATMFDDGQHGDTLANDGIYGISLPIQPNGTIVEFYIHTTDSTNHARTWPAPALDAAGTPTQTANCLYQVDNTTYQGSMPIYRMITRAVDKSELTQINTDSPAISGIDQTFSEVQMNATFISIDGTGSELRYRCGLRNRGASSRKTQPQSYRINFLNEQSWDGITALNLNTQYTYCQLLGSAAYRKAGATMAMSRPVQVRVNATNPTSSTGSPAYGFYVANEVLNSDYAQNHYPLDSSGNIYRSLQMIYSNTVPGGNLGDWSNDPDPSLADPTPYRAHYFKRTNQSEDNWSDLIGLTQKLAKGHSPTRDAPTWDADYATAVRSAVDVEQWMRFFAIQTIADNAETNLSNGRGDDFSMYFGVLDPRCKLIPYDLDSVFGRESISKYNDSLWQMCENPSMAGTPPTPVNPFMKHPEFAPLYFAELKRIIDGPLSPTQFNTLADETLGGLVNASLITSMKNFHANRCAWITSQLPNKLSVTTFPTVVNGYPKSTSATTTLGGLANAITTRSIKVNGTAASWTAWTASWTASNITLKPGINRILIQAFDASATETEQFLYDVWYDDSSIATVTSNITTHTTWTAAGGPWQITTPVAVTNGATLTIEPGASVYLSNNASLTIESGARLIAEGTNTNRIRISSAPGSATAWAGIIINGTTATPESRIAYTRIDGNTATAIDVNAADVTLDHLEFGTTTSPYLSLDGASFVISNSSFPAPSASIKGVRGTLGVKTGGRGLIRHCWFGAAYGYNDVIDFSGGQRPAPILQVIDNVFSGSSDDILKLNGTDAWVESNIFLHCHKNGSTPDSSAAISGGSNGSLTSEITIIGNLFYDVDHAVTAKQGNYYSFINNTVTHQTKSGGIDTESAIFNLQDAIPTPASTYAQGIYAEANIFSDCEQLVRNYNASSTVVTLNNNLMEFSWTGPGSSNTSGDPLFLKTPVIADTTFTSWSAAQIMKQWATLKSGSPAHASGPNGRDKGCIITRGICLSSNVPTTTNLTSATITVGPRPSTTPTWSAGYTHYRWRLDGGAWSAETAITNTINLSALSTASHTIEVIGKNDAGFWQDDALLDQAITTASWTWTVNPAYTPPAAAPLVRINEVLAKNVETLGFSGNYPDLIELHNAGTATATLDGWGLTDDASVPYKYTLPAGTTLAAGAYLTLYASSAAAVPTPKTGFGLKDQGDTLTLTRSVASGGGVADAVAFGSQLADYSIGRRSVDGQWDLCRPTVGASNVVAIQGNPSSLHINEWLASAGALSATDFIELFNPTTQPINIGNGYLTDNPVDWPNQHPIRQLTFVGASSYALFKADGDTNQGPDHLSFRLSASQGEIGLFTSDLSAIDSIVYGPQATDVSQGRSPNGADAITLFSQPTPGGPNPGTTATPSTTTINLLPINASWKYKSSATDYSSTFQAVAFNDSSWTSGPQLLHYETNTLTSASGFTKNTSVTPLNGTIPYATTYFRTHFTWNGSTTGVVLRATTMIDDGAVIYLNGVEALRVRMAAGTVSFGTYATASAPSSTNDAIEETLYLPANLLVEGDNVIAVEVHQNQPASSDVVWGMKLDAEVTNTMAATQVVINEVLVRNDTTPNPDTSLTPWLELYNPADSAADIADMSLTLSASSPRTWIAPAGTVIPAGSSLVIQCNPSLPASASNSGFALDPNGGSLYLFLAPAIGGGLRDSVTWGHQLPDRSFGRIPHGTGNFALNLPTRATLNSAAATGSLTAIKVNEWLASPSTGADWFELFNTGSTPVLLGGNYLTDTLTKKTQFLIPPLTFIGGSGTSRWLHFIADSNASALGHVNFSLSGSGEALGIFTAAGIQLDALAFGLQTTGVSQGRFPDGAASIVALVPTPAALNTLPDPDSDGDGMPDAWETANGLTPGSASDANQDADHDGMTNLQEYLAGTSPIDASSRFTNTINHDNGTPTIRFTARAGRGYTVQVSDSLHAWTKLTDVAPQAVTAEVSVADPAATTQSHRFYRILTPPQP